MGEREFQPSAITQRIAPGLLFMSVILKDEAYYADPIGVSGFSIYRSLNNNEPVGCSAYIDERDTIDSTGAPPAQKEEGG